MTDKQGTQRIPFDVASCVAMMEKMMAQMGAECDCTEMMSRMTSQAGPGCCDWSEMMSQMTATCCGAQTETEGEPTTEATEQA